MMKRIAAFAVGLLLLTTSQMPAAGEDLASQLVGVWKFVGVSNKEAATGSVTHPFGEKPIGYLVYTKGGRLIFSVVGNDRARPAGAVATDAERLRLYDTLAAGTGTFKTDGDTLMTTYDSSWLQTWTGTTQKRKAVIAGNKLTITSDPYKNLEGKEITFEAVYERVE